MNELTLKVGARIRQLRKQKGYTKEQLAFESNMHPAQIGHIERGTQSSTVDTLEKIINALDISIQDFFSFEEISLNKENPLKLFLNTLSQDELNDVSTILIILKNGKVLNKGNTLQLTYAIVSVNCNVLLNFCLYNY